MKRVSSQKENFIPKEDIKKLNGVIKGRGQKNFQERANEKIEKAKKKREMLEKEMEERALKECTFAPKTLRQTEKRKFEDFLKDQQHHLKKRQDEIIKMAKENDIKQDSAMLSQPKINEHSKLLTENKENVDVPVHERLYAKSKTTAKPKEEKEVKQVVKKHDEHWELKLYEEAQRRQEKWEKEQREALNKKKNETKTYSRDPYVQQKYIKEFSAALIASNIPAQGGTLSYDQVKTVLINLSFIKPTIGLLNQESEGKNKEDPTISMEKKIWEVMEGEKRNYIHSENLKVFTAAILKIMLNPEDLASTNKLTSKYGTFDENGIFRISQAEAIRIHKDFILLYLNRRSYNSPALAKQTDDSKCTFKPSLCEKSMTMASVIKDKYASRDVSLLSANDHVDVFSMMQKQQDE